MVEKVRALVIQHLRLMPNSTYWVRTAYAWGNVHTKTYCATVHTATDPVQVPLNNFILRYQGVVVDIRYAGATRDKYRRILTTVKAQVAALSAP